MSTHTKKWSLHISGWMRSFWASLNTFWKKMFFFQNKIMEKGRGILKKHSYWNGKYKIPFSSPFWERLTKMTDLNIQPNTSAYEQVCICNNDPLIFSSGRIATPALSELPGFLFHNQYIKHQIWGKLYINSPKPYLTCARRDLNFLLRLI